MRKYIFKRLLQLIPLLIGISLISFFVMHLAPGDPTALFIDPNVRPEELARVRANWGLDQPVIIQYFLWLKNACLLDFGQSYTTSRNSFSSPRRAKTPGSRFRSRPLPAAGRWKSA